jgi:ABC-2 type transport system ATP-binding protein
MNTAETLCDFIFMIFKGSKVLDGTLRQIQDTYRADTLKVRVDGGMDALRALAGIEGVTDRGPWQEVRLAAGVDAQEVLKCLAARTRVEHFELARPSLHEIFVRIAGPDNPPQP